MPRPALSQPSLLDETILGRPPADVIWRSRSAGCQIEVRVRHLPQNQVTNKISDNSLRGSAERPTPGMRPRTYMRAVVFPRTCGLYADHHAQRARCRPSILNTDNQRPAPPPHRSNHKVVYSRDQHRYLSYARYCRM